MSGRPSRYTGVVLVSRMKWTAVLPVVLALMLPAPADAGVHRFTPATEVTVSFTLTKRLAKGTLLRFARNRVSLARTPSGALALKAPGRRARRLARRGHRRMRVVVALSTVTGRAKLSARRSAATLLGGFVAESAVTVRDGRGVKRLRIRTGRRQAPASPPSDSPVGVLPAPAATGLFAPDSVWNAPLPPDAPLDPANAVLVKTLRDTVAQNEAAGWGPWIATAETSPLYIVAANQPTVRVQLDPGSWKTTLQQAFDAVPIPPNAVAAAGPDAHMTIWQPATDHLWEFFQARKQADGWHASFGGAMSNVSRSPGYYDAGSWPGLSGSYWGATATSLPVIAGTVMTDELKAGVIPHALAMNIPWAKPKTYSWPAQRTDGSSADPNAIPEGARFRLDPALNIDALNLPPMTRILAKAAQQYGMIVRDQTGHAISFFAENTAPSGLSPYTTSQGFFGGPDPTAVMQAFPWDHVQLVKMDLRTMN
jgi:hypothetical protein